MAKPKAEKVKVEWRRMPEVEALIEEIVEQHHRHLARAKILALGKPKATKRAGGKVNVAKAKRATPALNALVKDELGEVHYLVEVGIDAWDGLDAKQRRIVLDHELCHFVGQDLETDKWGLVGHDVEEFTDILRRHGAWTADLQLFAKECQQLSLDLSGV